MHYLDDFLVFGAPGTLDCGIAMGVSRQLCKELGVLLALHKFEGPGTVISFLRLGILIDTHSRCTATAGRQARSPETAHF